MTRVSVNHTLSRLYWLLTIVLLLLLAAKFADDIPGVPPGVVSVANQLYEFMRDMSLLIATGGVAYLSNIFQKRSKFVESLKEEWRNIVRTKSVLLSTCEKPYLATDDYLAAFYKVSETIDTMRIVYRNAGETGGLIGLYPFEPLHDMRRALQTLDPRLSTEVTTDQKNLARDAILQAFNALRETFRGTRSRRAAPSAAHLRRAPLEVSRRRCGGSGHAGPPATPARAPATDKTGHRYDAGGPQR